jgi:hypothetical protein
MNNRFNAYLKQVRFSAYCGELHNKEVKAKAQVVSEEFENSNKHAKQKIKTWNEWIEICLICTYGTRRLMTSVFSRERK